jgi:hypothetical protein
LGGCAHLVCHFYLWHTIFSNTTPHSSLLFTSTQKKFLPFFDLKKTRFPLICSTIHSGCLSIKLAKRFFALLLLGVTNARVIVLVCNVNNGVCNVTIKRFYRSECFTYGAGKHTTNHHNDKELK